PDVDRPLRPHRSVYPVSRAAPAVRAGAGPTRCSAGRRGALPAGEGRLGAPLPPHVDPGPARHAGGSRAAHAGRDAALLLELPADRILGERFPGAAAVLPPLAEAGP